MSKKNNVVSIQNFLNAKSEKENPFKDYEIPYEHFDNEFVEGSGGLREPAKLIEKQIISKSDPGRPRGPTAPIVLKKM